MLPLSKFCVFFQLSVASLISFLPLHAAEPVFVVFQNGGSVPLSSIALQEDKLVITAPTEGFVVGQAYSMALADHIYGEKPAEINQGIALILLGRQDEGLKLLEPLMVSQQASAKIPGNFWLETARAVLVAYAVNRNAERCAEIGSQISDSTPAQGVDPFVSLAKVLLMPSTTAPKISEVAFSDLTTDNLPADVAAYASYYRGILFKKLKQNKEARESFLSVSTLYPAGGIIINGAAEFQAAEYLLLLGRGEETKSILKSSISQTNGTVVAEEANKKLINLK